jgi:uncharacterized protein YjbI with pentapeptide repeats
MAQGKGTSAPQQDKEARQSKPWTLRERWGKPNWDWMQLGVQILGALLFPALIAYVGLQFASDLDDRQLAFQSQLDARQRDAEEQRAQDLALQGYLDTMSTLVLKDLDDKRVQAVMRARTLTALERLNPGRKTEVVQFLVEADLASGPGETQPVVSLTDADLHDVNLTDSFLDGAKLNEANLHDALLGNSHLLHADLSWANLNNANLYGTHLQHADLRNASLEDADLRKAILHNTNLNLADLRGANLSGAYTDILTLRDADLSGAQFSGDTTMPDGEKYENWEKDRD